MRSQMIFYRIVRCLIGCLIALLFAGVFGLMVLDQSYQVGEPAVMLRPLDIVTCAKCGEKMSIIQVNGKAVQVEPVAGVTGTSYLFQAHICKPVEPETAAPKSNGWKRR